MRSTGVWVVGVAALLISTSACSGGAQEETLSVGAASTDRTDDEVTGKPELAAPTPPAPPAAALGAMTLAEVGNITLALSHAEVSAARVAARRAGTEEVASFASRSAHEYSAVASRVEALGSAIGALSDDPTSKLLDREAARTAAALELSTDFNVDYVTSRFATCARTLGLVASLIASAEAAGTGSYASRSLVKELKGLRDMASAQMNDALRLQRALLADSRGAGLGGGEGARRPAVWLPW